MAETTKNTFSFLPNATYLIGAQYINGHYMITNRETGEVREGDSDKWILYFADPLDRNKSNCRASFGSGVRTEEVKSSDIPFVFGCASEREFTHDTVQKLIGSRVLLDMQVNGSRAVLRSIIPMN